MKKALIERAIQRKRTDKGSYSKLVETDNESSNDDTEPVERSSSGKALPEGKEHIIDKIPHKPYRNRSMDDMILV